MMCRTAYVSILQFSKTIPPSSKYSFRLVSELKSTFLTLLGGKRGFRWDSISNKILMVAAINRVRVKKISLQFRFSSEYENLQRYG